MPASASISCFKCWILLCNNIEDNYWDPPGHEDLRPVRVPDQSRSVRGVVLREDFHVEVPLDFVDKSFQPVPAGEVAQDAGVCSVPTAARNGQFQPAGNGERRGQDPVCHEDFMRHANLPPAEGWAGARDSKNLEPPSVHGCA